MDKYIFNEDNHLWYELIGDYYFPCLNVPAEEEQPVGIWGQRHLRYIREYRKVRYTSLLLGGRLNATLPISTSRHKSGWTLSFSRWPKSKALPRR